MLKERGNFCRVNCSLIRKTCAEQRRRWSKSLNPWFKSVPRFTFSFSPSPLLLVSPLHLRLFLRKLLLTFRLLIYYLFWSLLLLDPPAAPFAINMMPMVMTMTLIIIIVIIIIVLMLQDESCDFSPGKFWQHFTFCSFFVFLAPPVIRMFTRQSLLHVLHVSRCYSSIILDPFLWGNLLFFLGISRSLSHFLSLLGEKSCKTKLMIVIFYNYYHHHQQQNPIWKEREDHQGRER